MKNPYIIPAAMICAAILVGFWMLKSPSEPQEVIVVEAARPEPPPRTRRPPPQKRISIYIAARDGNIAAVKQHLADGANVNAKTETDFGSTLLHGAAIGEHKEIIELLIDNGADVNAKTNDGRTPLDGAMRFYNHPETADLLRKHGGKTKKELEAAGN